MNHISTGTKYCDGKNISNRTENESWILAQMALKIDEPLCSKSVAMASEAYVHS